MAKFQFGSKKKFNEVARSQQSGAALGPNEFGNATQGIAANPPGKKKNRRGSGKSKNKLVFDRAKRVDFVTGFKKRKDERRVQAKEQLLEEKRAERKELLEHKRQQRQNIEEQYEQLRQLKLAEMGVDPNQEKEQQSEDGKSENKKITEGFDDDAYYAFTKA